MPTLLTRTQAFGAPGSAARWTSARKEGIGTAYSSSSRVWFTLWRGIVTEVYYPTVDHPQIRDWQLLVTDGENFLHEEKRDFIVETSALDDQCLGFKVTLTAKDNSYALEKIVISDPHSPCVLQKIKLIAPPELRARLRVFTLCAPHLGAAGAGNNGHVCRASGRNILVANKKNTWLAVGTTKPFKNASCGFVGSSDGWTDLAENFHMDWQFDCALNGNIALIGEIDTTDEDFVLALAFGHGLHNVTTELMQSLAIPFDTHLHRFKQQWQRALKWDTSLEQSSSDSGKLYSSSYKLLIAHEDKLNPGAFIASLSIPWGQAKGDEDIGGYHLVWPRDLVNTATGLLAAGNNDTPLRALIFLAAAQKEHGGFHQNFWINGDPYWTGVQLDEVSFPIMLAWRLKQHGALMEFDAYPLVLSAASFLLLNGPITQQERWEEVAGFSPSTLAANIAGLTCAALFARSRGDSELAEFIQDYADYLRCHLEEWTVTTCGDLLTGIREYFVRVNPARDPEAVLELSTAEVKIANLSSSEQNVFPARNIVDGGFLELVRYGIYAADAPIILQTVAVIDEVLKVDTKFGPCWRRYNHDGYGQKADGSPFTGTGVGRAWPLLTGERGHYELAAGNDISPYIKAMESFASCGGTLPEQVWDKDDLPQWFLFNGKPTGAAMPLAWAHGEYIKLLRSKKDKRVFDLIPEVAERYINQPQLCKLLEIWHMGWQITSVRCGFTLRILSANSFNITYSLDSWSTTETGSSIDTIIGISYFDLEITSQKSSIEFTFFWIKDKRWEGRNFSISVLVAQ